MSARDHLFRMMLRVVTRALLALMLSPAVAAAQVTDGPADLRHRLDTIERKLDRLSRSPQAGSGARLPGLRNELRLLERDSLRQAGPEARANEAEIRALRRRLEEMGPDRDVPVPGFLQRRDGGGRTRLITPAIPETDLRLEDLSKPD